MSTASPRTPPPSSAMAASTLAPATWQVLCRVCPGRDILLLPPAPTPRVRTRALLAPSLAGGGQRPHPLSLSHRVVVSHTLPAEQMRAVAGLGLALFAGFHGSKATARVVGNHVASRLGRPPLVRETSRRRSAAPKQQQRPRRRPCPPIPSRRAPYRAAADDAAGFSS